MTKLLSPVAPVSRIAPAVFIALLACAPATEPTVIVLNEADLVGVSVEPNQLAVPKEADWLLALEEGDILASAVGRGFLREVTSINSAATTTTIGTIQASLDDALLNQSFEISEDDKAAGIQDVGFGIADLSTVLYEDDHAKLEVSEGYIRFRPTVDLDVELSSSGIDFVELSVAGEIDIRTVLKASVDGSFSDKMSVNVWKNEWHFVQLVGVVPVVEVVTASLDAELEIDVPLSASVEVGAKVKGTVRGGLRYEGGEFAPFGDEPSFRFDPIDPILAGEAGIIITGRLKPKLEVSVYELASISLAVEGEVRFEGDLIERSCELSSAIAGSFGASVGALSFKREFDEELFRIGKDLGCTL